MGHPSHFIQDASTAGPGICPSENHQKTIRSDLGNTRRAGLEEGHILFANGSVQASGVRASARAIWKVQVILLLSGTELWTQVVHILKLVDWFEPQS